MQTQVLRDVLECSDIYLTSAVKNFFPRKIFDIIHRGERKNNIIECKLGEQRNGREKEVLLYQQNETMTHNIYTYKQKNMDQLKLTGQERHTCTTHMT